MKSIIHIDMNAFFISCETIENSSLAGKPAAVAGEESNRSGIILSPNYEARKYGVKTTMLNSQARSLCPEIILIPPRHPLYESYSKRIMDILSQFSDLVEPFSIDEAWVDITNVQHLFGNPIEIAKKIKKQIKEKVGIQCSVGIASNKILAKMASEYEKPDGLTLFTEEDISNKLWPLPVNSLIYVGQKSAEKLNKIGIMTIGDLAKAKVGLLTNLLGKYGTTIHSYANGFGDDIISPRKSEEKSISHTVTLSRDYKTVSELAPLFLSCCEEAATRLRSSRMLAGVIGIILRYNDFTTVNRQITLKKDTDITEEIYHNTFSLLEQNWKDRPVRLIGVYLNKLSTKPLEIQLDFFGDCKRAKLEKLNHTIDEIRKKYGTSSIQRSSMLKK